MDETLQTISRLGREQECSGSGGQSVFRLVLRLAVTAHYDGVRKFDVSEGSEATDSSGDQAIMNAESCDGCGRPLERDEAKYVVELRVFPAAEPVEPHEPEGDRDHLGELEEGLEHLTALQGLGEAVSQETQCLVCESCMKRIVENPLDRDLAAAPWSVSNN